MVIYQSQQGYCYNSDTIFLYHFLSKHKLYGNVLDVGTGSGILALLVARDYPKTDISAIELQEHFVQIARINAQANKKSIKIYLGDFLQMIFDKKFDFIISNPPFYHPNVLRSQNKIVDKARYSGFLPMKDFFKKVSSLLKPRGSFIFCYDAKQLQNILFFLEKYKFVAERMQFVHPKQNKEATLVMIVAKKGSRSLNKVDPPLIVFDEKGEYKETTKNIFKKVGVHSIKCHI